MSNENVFKKVWTAIKGAFKWIVKAFKDLPEWVKKISPIVFATMENIKGLLTEADKWIEGPTGDLITRVIPGGLDDKIRGWLIIALPKAINVIVSVEDCQGDLGCMIKKMLAFLAPQKPATQESLLQKTSSVLLATYDEHKLNDNQYDWLAQTAYSGRKEVKEPNAA